MPHSLSSGKFLHLHVMMTGLVGVREGIQQAFPRNDSTSAFENSSGKRRLLNFEE
jgi:hypothetical protein